MKNIKLVILLFFIGILSTIAQEKRYITYKVSKGETLYSISKKLFVTPFDLIKLNPDVNKNIKVNDILIVPNKNYNPLKEIHEVDLKSISEKDIVVDNFIYHNVLSKETLYSIQKKYNVSNAQLNKWNPFLVEEGLKLGHVLKMPLQVSEAEVIEKDESTQPYLVKQKETKYGIAKAFDISIEVLEQLNPKIKKDGLNIGDFVLVPKQKSNKKIVYTEHTIEKLETLYSLSNRFEISQEELITANPQLRKGVQKGILINIPKRQGKTSEFFVDEIEKGKKLEVAMMLPFLTKQDSLNFKKNKLLNITTDFYFGALLALDSLKQQGLSVHMKVYDTQNSEFISKKLSEKSEFKNYDVIIGPLFLKNVKAVSHNLKSEKVIIVSPISTKDHSGINNNNNLVQEVTSKEYLARKMLEYIKSNYSNQKLIVILGEEELDEGFTTMVEELKALDPTNPLTIIKPKKGYIRSNLFKSSIVKNKENWFLLLSSNGNTAADVVNNLGVLPEENKITLFAFEKGKNFDKVNNSFLAKANFHYPTFHFDDEESSKLKYFYKKYRKIYKGYPSKYAVTGFDVTYDILMRLANDTNLVNQGLSQRLATRYNFIENTTSGGIVNQGVFIIKYDGLKLKIVK
ncbi:MAG: LysM peptidoglycan-binding domain-containing protein [Flavobacteriaceae bacterium]|nr:LysM peptidoglycan-binding domain-containing protein [Flavobacteriaceae bacterium]